jgi:hypothetical protein
MTDIEITEKIKNLKWDIDLEAGTVKSDLVYYRIVKKEDYTDLKSEWVSPDMPLVASVINEIQIKAAGAYKKAING